MPRPGSDKKKMRVSVSGGRTSMFMAVWLKENKSDEYDFLFQFANTSREHPDTLRFLKEADERFGLGVVWVEAVVHRDQRKACTSRVVDFNTAKRNGEVFDDVCSKYGIPNKNFLFCTREMKKNPMDHHAKSVGFGGAEVAIGIRADEKRRVSPNATHDRIVYPLVDMISVTKEEILEYFCWFKFDLNIPEHLGNCVDCHKKSDRKLQAVMMDDPGWFDFSMELDDKYSSVGPNCIPGPRKRYRGYRDTRQLLADLGRANFHPLAVIEGGCSESCEMYETEPTE